MKILAAALLCGPLLSCSIVTSKQPVGARPVDFTAFKLEGAWKEDGEEAGETFGLSVKDSQKGTVVLSQGDDESEVVIRQSGQTVFANVFDKDSAEYAWVKIELEGNTLRMLHPDVDRFADLVRQNKIPGKVTQQKNITKEGVVIPGSLHVTLNDPSGRWVESLVSGTFGDPFVNDDVTTWQRGRGPIIP